ncbi:MAG: cation diffusion facilitator family transporter [Elusimicrobia bacterium]|nr:cation diffusion facilitator family transporter [Elusimicrobiota bacterium]
MGIAPYPAGIQEKKDVALSSLLAAVALTGTKLAVGLWTNSLGILSEALHSGLDLVAAAVTLWAVHVSGRPADKDHAYGHGKIENLSALFETFLLAATCAWIVWEAVERLCLREAAVEVNAWSFGVIALSIAVDYSRSRSLKLVAVKYDSQALEADALHFSTDIWSSLAVLLGLAGVVAAHRTGAPWLVKADAAAALAVAAIVLSVCWRLGRRAVDELLDAAPRELHDAVAAAAAKVPGVLAVRKARVRRSGPEVFADVTLAVPEASGLDAAHDIADRAEAAVRAALPGADVVVHVEPEPASPEDTLGTARRLAARQGLHIHSLRVYDEEDAKSVELHLEVSDSLSLEEAHRQATAYEDALRSALPRLADIATHIEPCVDDASAQPVPPVGAKRIREAIDAFLREHEPTASVRDLKVRSSSGKLAVSVRCLMAGSANIRDAHAFTERLEGHLRAAIPLLHSVVVHAEPLPPAGSEG